MGLDARLRGHDVLLGTPGSSPAPEAMPERGAPLDCRSCTLAKGIART